MVSGLFLCIKLARNILHKKIRTLTRIQPHSDLYIGLLLPSMGEKQGISTKVHSGGQENEYQ